MDKVHDGLFRRPSFHEGRGSVCVALDLLSAESAVMTAHINAAMAANNDKALVIRLRFTCLAGRGKSSIFGR